MSAGLNTIPTPALTVASFFSGIGGFDLGFERAGFTVTMQCEIDKYCTNILHKHWPNKLRFGDIKKLDEADERIHVAVGNVVDHLADGRPDDAISGVL